MWPALQRQIRRSLRSSTNGLLCCRRPQAGASSPFTRHFHQTGVLGGIKPYLLADIGEGITECQITSWFVKPGDRVQQFDAICEVQSDKASVEITSRFDGVIRKLHHEVDDMAAVGSPLVDIEVEDGDEAAVPTPSPSSQAVDTTISSTPSPTPTQQPVTPSPPGQPQSSEPKNSGLVIPAVRHLIKQHKLDLADIEATGKGERVTKEDVQKHLARIASGSASPAPPSTIHAPATPSSQPAQDQILPLTPIQHGMFQSMSKALAIPHFLYTHIVDMTDLTTLRKRFTTNPAMAELLRSGSSSAPKLTPLPFVLKALSQAISKFPIVNATLDIETSPGRPQLVVKGSHNIGVAMDTPKGLVVPVIRDVQNQSIVTLAARIERLSRLARDGKLSPDDMKGATIVVSNIGSIGGHAVAPVILSPMVMILGIGRSQNVPVYKTDNDGNEQLIKREQVVLSWSADHRVLDGATVARCAQSVGSWLENADGLGLVLK